jgi:hypothetical protein
MLKLTFARSLMAAFTVSACMSATAVDLVGDTLSFLRGFPTTTTQFGQAIPDATVVAGTSDQVQWRGSDGVAYVSINPEPDRVVFTFLRLGITGGTASTFDGFVINAFDNNIVSRSVIGGLPGMVTLGGGNRDVTVNLNGTFMAGESFAVVVSVVPESTTVALFSCGLGALLLRCRRAQ